VDSRKSAFLFLFSSVVFWGPHICGSLFREYLSASLDFFDFPGHETFFPHAASFGKVIFRVLRSHPSHRACSHSFRPSVLVLRGKQLATRLSLFFVALSAFPFFDGSFLKDSPFFLSRLFYANFRDAPGGTHAPTCRLMRPLPLSRFCHV